jgi:hypothetical protein
MFRLQSRNSDSLSPLLLTRVLSVVPEVHKGYQLVNSPSPGRLPLAMQLFPEEHSGLFVYSPGSTRSRNKVSTPPRYPGRLIWIWRRTRHYAVRATGYDVLLGSIITGLLRVIHYEIVLFLRVVLLLSRSWIHIQLGPESIAGLRPAVSN